MPSMKQLAINAKCKDCCYDELDQGTWREQVERNDCGNCPLAEFKPKTIATQRKEKAFIKLLREQAMKSQDYSIR